VSLLTLSVLHGLAFAEPSSLDNPPVSERYEESVSYEESTSVVEASVNSDDLTMRLLGGAVGEETLIAGVPGSVGSPWPVVWLLGGFCVAGAGWAARRKILGNIVPVASPLEVVGRTMLHGSNGLVMVNVEAGDGSTRRLLVGIGGDSPQLVADLGVCDGTEAPTEISPGYDAVAQTVDVATLDMQAVAKPVYDDLEMELEAQPAYVVDRTPTTVEEEHPRQDRMDAARAVLNEILAERQRSTQTSPTDGVQR
jgi:hypothetical protein